MDVEFILTDKAFSVNDGSGAFGGFRGHMHIFPFSFASPEAERARRAPRRSVIDCLEAIMRKGNLNSRTTPKGRL